MSKIYQNNIVAFIDILGFKEFLKVEDKAEKILELLSRLKQLEKGESNISMQRNGQITEFVIEPVVTCFSDNIVISLSEDHLSGFITWGHVVVEFVNRIQWMAMSALQEGLLIRGGMTIGSLYHKNGMVFGPGFIESHYLESKVAIYPRIIAARSLVDCLRKNGSGAPDYFFQDVDGIFSLDYLTSMIPRINDKEIEEVTNVIKANISKFGDVKTLKELAKWQWFQRSFNSSLQAAKFDLNIIKQNT